MAYEINSALLAQLPRTGPTDPIEFYKRPLVGRLFLARINLGLGLLGTRRFERALEVGYGAGAVQLALAPGVAELHGIDLDADPAPASALLSARGIDPHLIQGSVLTLPYPDAHFDLVVSFSVFEHLHEHARALREVHRVLKPGAFFLLGMPSVNKLMEAGFLAIGFKGIEDHHVTTPRQVSAGFRSAGFRVVDCAFLDLPAPRPLGMRLYNNWLLERREPA